MKAPLKLDPEGKLLREIFLLGRIKSNTLEYLFHTEKEMAGVKDIY